MSPRVLRSLLFAGNLRRRTDRSRIGRRLPAGLEQLEDRVTPTSVTGLNPTAGPLAGGTSVTLSGTGFTGATAVDFGALSATSFVVVSGTTITALSPPDTGTVGVTVTTASGTSVVLSADQFTYAQVPTVTGLSPADGPLVGGTLVTITGTDFTGATAVDFGTSPATNVTVVSNTTITAVSPPGITGSVAMTVSTPGGASMSSTAPDFTYMAAPIVSGLSMPNFGPAGGGTMVTISGSGFTGVTGVEFGTVPATDVNITSSSTITALSPGGTGTVDVTVTTLGGPSATTADDLFTYSPTILAISPAAGPLAGGNLITITGTGFNGATAVDFGSMPAASFTVVGPSTISAVTPAGAGAVSVSVSTPSGTSATPSAHQFVYMDAPTVSGISPSAGPLIGGTLVTIAGAGFTGATAVDFGASPATNVMVVSDTTLTAVSPAGSLGSVPVTVTAPGGTSTSSMAPQFTYLPAPVVSLLSTPNFGPAAGGTVVTITGAGFNGVTAVNFGTIPATIVSVSATSLTVYSPAGTGTVNVNVTAQGGTSATSPDDLFTYGPTISAISPAAGPGTGNTLVTITGTGFTNAIGVTFGTTPAISFAVVNTTTITAVTPAGAGTVPVSVTTAGGTAATPSTHQFTYATQPTISAISPSAGPLGGGTLVTITGTGFTGATAVDFGAAAATNVTVLSGTTITADSPAGTGMVNVTVTAPGGISNVVAADQFTYMAAPIVSGVSPTVGPAAGDTLVTIAGTGFTGVTGVDFGTIPATIVSESATSLTAYSPAGTGAVDVTVTAGWNLGNRGDRPVHIRSDDLGHQSRGRSRQW